MREMCRNLDIDRASRRAAGVPKRPRQWPWFLLCLSLFFVVGLYDFLLDPIVRAFGLAHTSIYTLGSKSILVTNSISSSDAHLVQMFFSGEIWGRHNFRTYLIVVPFLLLVAAFFVLCKLLASSLSLWGRQFFCLDDGSELPTFRLWLAFFFGGCLATISKDCGVRLDSWAFLPLAIAVFGIGFISAIYSRKGCMLARAIAIAGAARWFGLGFLVFIPGNFFYEQSSILDPSGLGDRFLFLAFVLGVLFIYWTCSIPMRPDYDQFRQDKVLLKLHHARYRLLCLQELWLLLPVAALAGVVGQLRAEVWITYFITSGASALAVRWSIDRAPSRLLWRILRLSVRISILSVGGFALAYYRELLGIEFPAAISLSLILLGVGAAGGVRWYTNSGLVNPKAPTSASRECGSYLKLLFPPLALVLLGAAMLATLLPVALTSKDLTPQVSVLARELNQEFGYKARLLQGDKNLLLIGCNLDLGARNQAAMIVAKELGDDSVVSMAVTTTKWEWRAKIALALSVAAFLAFPAYLLTLAPSGAAPLSYMVFCALLGGLNGAFALGASLGWFWLDPTPHIAAFALAVCLEWLGMGFARDWLDRRVGITPASS